MVDMGYAYEAFILWSPHGGTFHTEERPIVMNPFTNR